jgi:hypothetical protein
MRLRQFDTSKENLKVKSDREGSSIVNNSKTPQPKIDKTPENPAEMI